MILLIFQFLLRLWRQDLFHSLSPAAHTHCQKCHHSDKHNHSEHQHGQQVAGYFLVPLASCAVGFPRQHPHTHVQPNAVGQDNQASQQAHCQHQNPSLVLPWHTIACKSTHQQGTKEHQRDSSHCAGDDVGDLVVGQVRQPHKNEAVGGRAGGVRGTRQPRLCPEEQARQWQDEKHHAQGHAEQAQQQGAQYASCRDHHLQLLLAQLYSYPVDILIMSHFIKQSLLIFVQSFTTSTLTIRYRINCILSLNIKDLIASNLGLALVFWVVISNQGDFMGIISSGNNRKPKQQLSQPDAKAYFRINQQHQGKGPGSEGQRPTSRPRHRQRQSIEIRQGAKVEKQIELDERGFQQQLKWYQVVYFAPDSRFIKAFKLVTLLLIYIYFLEIPITIAFDNHRNQNESERFFAFINVPAIAVFVLGVLIKLKTSYYKEGILISDQSKILIHYVIYILAFDFLSLVSIIVYEFSELLREQEEWKGPLSYRFIVLLFYLKIPEVMSIEGSIVSALDLNRRAKACCRLLLLMVKIFVLCNIAACGFFYISDNICPMTGCSTCCWIYQKEVMGEPLKNATWVSQYVFSLYWGSTTMLTIGYGDITPDNVYEAAYTIVTQFVSCLLYAFSINQVWTIILDMNSKRAKIHSRMNVINVYMRDKDVGGDLKSRVNAYLSHFYHTKNLRQKDMESEIISELTPSLKRELYFEAYGFIFNKHPLFKMFSEQFLEQVSENIHEVGYFEGEVVYSPATEEEQLPLYYIYKGQLQSYVDLGNFRTRNVVLQNLEAGQIFGLYEFIRQVNYNSSMMAKKYCLLYCLTYEHWIQNLSDYEQDFENYFILKHSAQYQHGCSKFKLSCSLCSSHRHQSDMCLAEQISSEMSSLLKRYLRSCHRTPYSRRNYKSNLTDGKPFQHLHQSKPEPRMKKRKASVMLSLKETPKSPSTKKRIFQRGTHKEKMSRIIEKKRQRESFLSSESEQSTEMASRVVAIDAVNNYDTYWPEMNSTVDCRERRKPPINLIFSDD